MFPFTIWAPMILPIVLGGHHRKILPYDMNGPFKQVMMSLFRLAWSSKIRLPLLITVAFLALDVHLQMEINVFWEANHREIENEDEEERRRQRRDFQQDQTRRILAQLQSAPLAEVEDLDDDSSTLSSLPSNIDASSTPPRYKFERRRSQNPIDEDENDEYFSEGEENLLLGDC